MTSQQQNTKNTIYTVIKTINVSNKPSVTVLSSFWLLQDAKDYMKKCVEESIDRLGEYDNFFDVDGAKSEVCKREFKLDGGVHIGNQLDHLTYDDNNIWTIVSSDGPAQSWESVEHADPWMCLCVTCKHRLCDEKYARSKLFFNDETSTITKHTNFVEHWKKFTRSSKLCKKYSHECIRLTVETARLFNILKNYYAGSSEVSGRILFLNYLRASTNPQFKMILEGLTDNETPQIESAVM